MFSNYYSAKITECKRSSHLTTMPYKHCKRSVSTLYSVILFYLFLTWRQQLCMILLPGFDSIYDLLSGKNNCLLIGGCASRKFNKKEAIERKKGFSHALFLFNNSSGIVYYRCPIGHISDNDSACTNCAVTSYFNALNDKSV